MGKKFLDSLSGPQILKLLEKDKNEDENEDKNEDKNEEINKSIKLNKTNIFDLPDDVLKLILDASDVRSAARLLATNKELFERVDYVKKKSMIFITDDTLIPINRVIGKTRINNNIFVNFKSNNIIIEKENGLVLNQVNLSKFKDILKIYYLSESMVLLITTPEYIYYNRLRLKFNDMEFNGIIERKNNILFTKFIFNDLSYTFDEPKAVVPEKIIRYKDLTIANSGLSSKLIILGIDDKYYISYEITYLNTQSIILLNNKDSDKKIKEFYEKYYDTIEEVIEKYYKNLNQYII